MSPELKQPVEIPETWTRCEIHGYTFPARETIYVLEEAGLSAHIPFGVGGIPVIEIRPVKNCAHDRVKFAEILNRVKMYLPEVEILFF